MQDLHAGCEGRFHKSVRTTDSERNAYWATAQQPKEDQP